MSREADIERVGNVLAGTMALLWFSRGILILTPRYREEASRWLDGSAADFLAPVLPAISCAFLITALLVILGPARIGVAIGQLVLVIAEWLLFAAVEPALMFGAFGSLTKNLALLTSIGCLLYLRTETSRIPVAERALRIGAGLMLVLHGFAALAAPAAGEAAVITTLGVSGEGALGLVRVAGVLQAVAGSVLIALPTHGRTVTVTLVFLVAQACIVPIVAGIVDGAWLYRPLAPLLKNVAIMGVGTTLLFLSRHDDVRFAGRVRAAERLERLLLGLRDSGRDESRSRLATVEGLTPDPSLPERCEDRVFGLVVAACRVAPAFLRRYGARVTKGWLEGLYSETLRSLSDRSLARRTFEGLSRSVRKDQDSGGGSPQ